VRSCRSAGSVRGAARAQSEGPSPTATSQRHGKQHVRQEIQRPLAHATAQTRGEAEPEHWPRVLVEEIPGDRVRIPGAKVLSDEGVDGGAGDEGFASCLSD